MMVKGKIELYFDNSDNFDCFYHAVTMMQRAEILPKDFGWMWEHREGEFVATIFSKSEARLQEERPTDDSSESDDFVDVQDRSDQDGDQEEIPMEKNGA